MTVIDAVPILLLQLLSAGLIISGSLLLIYRLFRDNFHDSSSGGGVTVRRNG